MELSKETDGITSVGALPAWETVPLLKIGGEGGEAKDKEFEYTCLTPVKIFKRHCLLFGCPWVSRRT